MQTLYLVCLLVLEWAVTIWFPVSIGGTNLIILNASDCFCGSLEFHVHFNGG